MAKTPNIGLPKVGSDSPDYHPGNRLAGPDALWLIYFNAAMDLLDAALGGGSGAAGPNFSDEEIPDGAIDGFNTAFTLAHAPNPPTSLILTLNGLVLQQGGGKDYTLSGANLTMITIPQTGHILLAWYRY